MRFVALLYSQAVQSSLTLVLTVLVARDTTVKVFAGLALALPGLILVQRFARVQVHIPRQLHSTKGSPTTGDTEAAISSCLRIAVAASAVFLVAALFTPSWLSVWVLSVACVLVPVVVADCIRNELVVSQDWGGLFALESFWFSSSIAAFAGIKLFDGPVHAYLLVWGLLLLPVAFAKIVALGLSWRRVELFRKAERRSPYADGVTDLLSSVLLGQALPYAVSGLSGLPTVAGLRGAQTLAGPVNVAVSGLAPAFTIAASRRAERGQGLVGFALLCASLSAVVAAVAAAGAIAIGDGLGVSLLGSTWEVAEQMITPIFFHVAVTSSLSFGFLVLRVQGNTRRLVRYRSAGIATQFSGALVGAIAGPPSGVAWGLAISSSVVLAVLFTRLCWKK